MSKAKMLNDISEDDLFPSLRELLKNELGNSAWPNLSKLSIGNKVDAQNQLLIPRREEIDIVYENRILRWRNDSIRALFRGNLIPPDLAMFPPEYHFFFFRIEKPIALFSKHPELALNDPDFEEIFSAMRRRPDGRRINLMHDLIWQAAAFSMALRPCSEAEYAAIFQRLERSASTFNKGRNSKNYLWYLREHF
ncbi:MAG: hypothetical protein ACYC4Q_11235 [Victivallaceae bacterium]